MSDWSRFWIACESLHAQRGTRADWSLWLPDDVPGPYPLRVSDPPARSLPDPRGADWPRWRVVRQSDGTLERIDPSSGRAQMIPFREIVSWQLDRVRILEGLSGVLPISVFPTPSPLGCGVWEVGNYTPTPGRAYPLLWAVPTDPAALLKALSHLTPRSEPGVLIVLTERPLRPESRKLLTRSRGGLFPLSACVTTSATGEWTLTEEGEQRLMQFREGVGECLINAAVNKTEVTESVPKPVAVVPFPTPPGAVWTQLRLQMIDDTTLRATIGPVTRVLTYAEMGLKDGRDGTPNRQWELLQTLAVLHGVLTWDARQAGSALRKRRQQLSRALRSFFQITGEPISYGRKPKGWRTEFSIVPQGWLRENSRSNPEEI